MWELGIVTRAYLLWGPHPNPAYINERFFHVASKIEIHLKPLTYQEALNVTVSFGATKGIIYQLTMKML